MTADSDQPKSSSALDPWKILESHPAFATDIGESSDDPALAGLQALKYESEDPDANALSYKDEGNYHYKRKEFSKAIDSYSGGLRAKPKDMNLVAVLLTNRAICHWYLKNYRSCIMDCKAALVADPQHQKAYVKAVEACLALDKIHDCLELCELGLTKFPGCQKLTEARAKARQKQNLSDQADIAKIKAQREEESKQLTTFKLITDRGIRVNFRLPPVCVPDAADARFYVDSSNHLHWSLLFMYPEFGQTDFLRDVIEDSTVLECLRLVFDPSQPPPAWDTEQIYRFGDDSLEVYFEDSTVSQKLVSFPAELTVKQLTKRKDFCVRRDLLIVIHVVSKRSTKFYQRWKDEMRWY